MVGGTHGRRGFGMMVLFLTGCVSLGDMPSETIKANRPRPQPAKEPPTPELRINDVEVAQVGRDIPLVPVPPPPFPQAPASGAASAPRGNSRGADATPLAGTRGADATPLAGTRGADATPLAGTRGADATPLAGTRGADATPLAGNPSPQADGTPPHSARQLLLQASSRCANLDSYIVRLTRREKLKGKAGPEEIIAFSFRKRPFSVHFKWLGETAKGREVVYVQGRFDNKIHTKVAAGDSILLPAGARLSLSPDNLLVRSASRHPITDAGICHCVETLLDQLNAQERGDRRQGTLSAIAPQRRPEFPQPVETVERLIPPGAEPELVRGGRRLIFFDADWHLPMLVITYDDKGKEVEYYRYDRLMAPAHLDDDDFNPNKLWLPANGGNKTPDDARKKGVNNPRSAGSP